MPWGRLDDSLYDHPKVNLLPTRLRNACVGLWIRAISWSNRYLTDGAIPTDRLLKLDGTKAHIDALVTAGMFDPATGGVTVHDFLSFNDSAEQVRQRRAHMQELGKRGGTASRSSGTLNGTPSDPPSLPANTRPSPVPSRPFITPPTPPRPDRTLLEIEEKRRRVEAEPIRPLEEIDPALAKWKRP